MATPAAEIDRVLREQNPWHHDGVVPPSLARPVERRMAAVLEGVVESDFVRDTYLGENVLPFRLLPARHSVLPIEGARLIPQDRLDLYPGLAAWWRDAERVWEANSKGRLTDAPRTARLPPQAHRSSTRRTAPRPLRGQRDAPRGRVHG